jgi:hypothetical protein
MIHFYDDDDDDDEWIYLNAQSYFYANSLTVY